MNISLIINPTTINLISENIVTLIKERLVSSNCTITPFLSGIEGQREDIDVAVEFNNIPVFIENSSIKFLHLTIELGYYGVVWEENTVTQTPSDCEIITGKYANNILWSTGELDGNGDHNEPIQLLTEKLDTELSKHIMDKVINSLIPDERDIFTNDVWSKVLTITQ